MNSVENTNDFRRMNEYKSVAILPIYCHLTDHFNYAKDVAVVEQWIIKNNVCNERVLGKRRNKKLKICIGFTKYNLIQRVAGDFGLREVGEKDNWNIYWTDSFIGVDKIFTLKEFQIINHFPGMIEICRKDMLARNINRMRKLFPAHYDIIPPSWSLPSDVAEFQYFCQNNTEKNFILKPEASCQGKGIFLTQSIRDLRSTEGMVCQVYISNPLLVDGYKFDMRIYVLITSVDPLRIYVYREGLVRFTTVKYETPSQANMSNILMHLTNYSLQKTSDNFVHDSDHCGSKRRISVFNRWLASSAGYDVCKLWQDIDDIIVKTMVTIQSSLKHHYRSSFPNHKIRCACFELLGFDIIVTNELKPLLIEVNHSPSFHTDAQIDMEVKDALLWDTFQILNMHAVNQGYTYLSNRSEAKLRLYSKMKQTNKLKIGEQRRLAVEAEMHNCGNYRLLYPGSGAERYDGFLNSTMSLFRETVSYRARLQSARKLRDNIRHRQRKIDAIRYYGMRSILHENKTTTCVRFSKRSANQSLRPRTELQSISKSDLSRAHSSLLIRGDDLSLRNEGKIRTQSSAQLSTDTTVPPSFSVLRETEEPIMDLSQDELPPTAELLCENKSNSLTRPVSDAVLCCTAVTSDDFLCFHGSQTVLSNVVTLSYANISSVRNASFFR